MWGSTPSVFVPFFSLFSPTAPRGHFLLQLDSSEVEMKAGIMDIWSINTPAVFTPRGTWMDARARVTVVSMHSRVCSCIIIY